MEMTRVWCFWSMGKDSGGHRMRMIVQLERVLDLATRLFPWAQFVFKFDHSSNHKAMAEDALNAKKMGVNPGGIQPKMRSGLWQGVEQKMVDEDGKPKGC